MVIRSVDGSQLVLIFRERIFRPEPIAPRVGVQLRSRDTIGSRSWSGTRASRPWLTPELFDFGGEDVGGTPFPDVDRVAIHVVEESELADRGSDLFSVDGFPK